VLANLLDPAASSKRSSITKAAVLADQLDEIGGPLPFVLRLFGNVPLGGATPPEHTRRPDNVISVYGRSRRGGAWGLVVSTPSLGQNHVF
jgi:hypothetical protein